MIASILFGCAFLSHAQESTDRSVVILTSNPETGQMLEKVPPAQRTLVQLKTLVDGDLVWETGKWIALVDESAVSKKTVSDLLELYAKVGNALDGDGWLKSDSSNAFKHIVDGWSDDAFRKHAPPDAQFQVGLRLRFSFESPKGMRSVYISTPDGQAPSQDKVTALVPTGERAPFTPSKLLFLKDNPSQISVLSAVVRVDKVEYSTFVGEVVSRWQTEVADLEQSVRRAESELRQKLAAKFADYSPVKTVQKFSDLSDELRTQLRAEVMRDWKSLGFASPEEAELALESSPIKSSRQYLTFSSWTQISGFLRINRMPISDITP